MQYAKDFILHPQLPGHCDRASTKEKSSRDQEVILGTVVDGTSKMGKGKKREKQRELSTETEIISRAQGTASGWSHTWKEIIKAKH